MHGAVIVSGNQVAVCPTMAIGVVLHDYPLVKPIQEGFLFIFTPPFNSLDGSRIEIKGLLTGLMPVHDPMKDFVTILSLQVFLLALITLVESYLSCPALPL